MGKIRGKTKESRDLIRDIERAGGEVRHTRRGHLRVQGPIGIAIVSPTWTTDRHRDNALTELATYAGIDLRRGSATPPRGCAA